VSSVKQKQAAIALVKELGFAFSINVVLHRANLDRIGEIIDLAAGYGADRLELANTQYYGWGLHNRATLMPTRDQVLRARDVAQDRMDRYKGQMQILFVLPDYFEELPKACYGGWTLLHRGGARRPGAPLPRRLRHPIAHAAQRAGSLDRLDLARIAGLSGVPRRRVDEGALPELPAEDRGLRRLPVPGAGAHG
jgi:MoaA/NifB/PqqE/SkfB family radical SAM enzyme